MLHPLFHRLQSVAGFHLVRLFFVELVGSMDRTIDAIPWNFFFERSSSSRRKLITRQRRLMSQMEIGSEKRLE